jgi:hypothetical protein
MTDFAQLQLPMFHGTRTVSCPWDNMPLQYLCNSRSTA